MIYDVAIVGAGPAGSVTAKECSKANLNVVLIDRKKTIGVPKQCAEGINKKIFEMLNIKVKNDWISSRINAMYIGSLNKKGFYLETGKTKGYILDRKIFDRDLAYSAVDNGTKMLANTMVENIKFKEIPELSVVSNKKRNIIQAKVVIGADGPISITAKKAGLEMPVNAVGLQYELKNVMIPEDIIKFYFSSFAGNVGGCWVFPKNDTMNVGLATRYTDTNKTKQFLELFIRKLGFEKLKIKEVNAGLIPISGPIKKFYSKNLLVIGDAAGHTNPVSGGGIPVAMFDGVLATNTVKKVIEENDFSEDRMSAFQMEWNKSVFGNASLISIGFQKRFLNMVKSGQYESMLSKFDGVWIRDRKDVFACLIKNPLVIRNVGFGIASINFYSHAFEYGW